MRMSSIAGHNLWLPISSSCRTTKQPTSVVYCQVLTSTIGHSVQQLSSTNHHWLCSSGIMWNIFLDMPPSMTESQSSLSHITKNNPFYCETEHLNKYSHPHMCQITIQAHDRLWTFGV